MEVDGPLADGAAAGEGTTASPLRCSSGPISRMGIRLTPEYMACREGPVIREARTQPVCSAVQETSAPRSASMSKTMSTSSIRGTLLIVHGWSVSSVATSCLVTAFLAPDARTVPRSGMPPVILYWCWSAAMGCTGDVPPCRPARQRGSHGSRPRSGLP